MKQKKDESLNNLVIISLALNVICLLVIIVIAYKLYKGSTSHPKTSQTPNKEKQVIKAELNQKTQKQNKKQASASVKDQTENIQYISQIKTLAPSKLKGEEKIQIQQILKTMNTQPIPNNFVSKTEIALKSQIQLEQQRSKYLQQQVQLLQEQLATVRQIPKIQQQFKLKPILVSAEPQQEITNLRNELQFCQNRLLQSYQTEKQLRERIQIYQKIGQRSLNHPEFQRLRQMNAKYKTIIANLQMYLLDKQNKAHLNISFNDL